jgi:tetratricopeptide (TPR) repeat protein
MARTARPGAASALLLAALLLPARAAAQEPVERALELEQRGEAVQAAAQYAAALRQHPQDVVALLGLERTAAQAGWRDTVLVYAARALAADSTEVTAYAVALRTLRSEGRDSAAAEVLRRWSAAQPRSPAPYREWAQASLRLGRLAEVRDVVQLARERLGRGDALAPELAQVEAAAGRWAPAATAWRTAVATQPEYADAAVGSLQPAPAAMREGVLNALVAAKPPADAAAGRRVAVRLLLRWNEPGRAWDLRRTDLPATGPARVVALRQFAQAAAELDGPGAQEAAGAAYEQLAAALASDDAVDARIASARAYAAAGDDAAAQRVLRTLATTRGADAATRASAIGAMVELKVRAGDPGGAGRLLAANVTAFSGTERTELGQLIARGWLRRGEPDSASRAVRGDPSLAADEVRGWVAVYGGALARGSQLLQSVGAAGGEPRRAAARAATVALLDAVGRDSLPALGAALLLAARGDTLASSRALTGVARALGADAAGGDAAVPALLAWAARFAATARHADEADSLWGAIAQRFPASAEAPEAELALARAQARHGDLRGAASRLEAMILAHPASALAPEARRELDRVRGLVPGGGGS